MSWSGRSLASLTLALAAAVGASVVTAEAQAASVIKRPGAHPDYVVELDPHGLIQWMDRPIGGMGFGLGMHATINIIEQGPIKKINNSMGLGFGIDWAHFGNSNGYYCYYGAGYWRNRVIGPGYDCSGNNLWFPIVWQWNFWLTDIISVFGEPGFAIKYWSVNTPCAVNGVIQDCTIDDITFRPIFWGGGRFMFGDTVGLNVKVGYPSFQVGASFLL